MKVMSTELPDVLILEPDLFEDDRGWFMESFNERKFKAALLRLGLSAARPFMQDNHSCSRRGVLRGLHYQLAPHVQGKLVRVTQGAAFDVAVDIRNDSPHFCRWVGVELTAGNRRQLWIPEGFAHGFLALQDETHFLYKTTDVYDKASERVIVWNDPDIGIDWPLNLLSQAPQLAAKDAAAPLLRNAQLS